MNPLVELACGEYDVAKDDARVLVALRDRVGHDDNPVVVADHPVARLDPHLADRDRLQRCKPVFDAVRSERVSSGLRSGSSCAFSERANFCPCGPARGRYATLWRGTRAGERTDQP